MEESVVGELKSDVTSSTDGDIVFHFKLPEDGLALRSVGIVDGVPQLSFKASPKVPTIQEEDVATVFRLTSKNLRPGFFYHGFPPTHPMHRCRSYMHYSPTWLRGTAVGELLAEVDWSMKCLHVGTRSNKDKSIFKAWSAESELDGLASHLDFPKDGSGPVMMSCDYAEIQKSDFELLFPKEPKMQICDHRSSLYSKYATEIYPSVAYYDEPNFLKMQELIKLILAVEWLYKEKGIRANQEWIMNHTSKFTNYHDTKKAPPYDMIPKLSVLKRPTSDVAVKTREAVLYDVLKTEMNVQRRYGYYDFSKAQVMMFTAEGTLCPPQKCLKLHCEHRFTFFNTSSQVIKECLYLPLPEQVKSTKSEILELLPGNSKQEIVTSTHMPVSVTRKVDDLSDGNKVHIKVTNVARCPPLLTATRITTATVWNPDEHFTDKDPQIPVMLAISPYISETVVPDVKSWDELNSELSVPIPFIWQSPYIGIGEPMAFGGVTTSSFGVREVPQQAARTTYQETHRQGNYSTNGRVLAVHSECVRTQGKIKLVSRQSPEFAVVSEKFTSSWDKGRFPSIDAVFSISNSTLERQWSAYRRTLGHHQESEEYYHGTTLSCSITTSQTLCSIGNCGICGISNSGLDPGYIRQNIWFQRFGSGFYLAPNSSKSHDYTKGSHGYRAMLLCDVLPGKKYLLTTNSPKLTGPPRGYNSVYGVVSPTSELNYPEIVVYEPSAVMPRYIIIYKLNGTDRPAN